MSPTTRRDFLKTTAAASALLLPGWTFPTSRKLRTAHIGVGGMGGADLNSIASHPDVAITALCDVDARRLAGAAKKFPKAATFADFRELLTKMADGIDAVVVSTPDHTHAPAAMAAMNLGKNVYCQKPLTHEIFEARRLRETAAEKKLVTQMGIQCHASKAYRAATGLIQSGVIGKVSAVHAWSFKNWGFDGKDVSGADPVPDGLSWDLWVGTAAKRPYKKRLYHPGNWRKQIDFGTGTLGDMGVHIFDTPFRTLRLTAPRKVKVTCRPPTGIGHPEKNVLEYQFPGTAFTTDTLLWRWYDGAFAPPKNANLPLPKGRKLPNQGACFIGEKGTCLLPHIGTPEFYAGDKRIAIEMPALPNLNHYHQWVDACLGRTKPSAHFGYAGPLTESLLIGVVAARFAGKTLDWDTDKLTFTNMPQATPFVKRSYRKGFEVQGLS